ncbi:unnamed protein product, partial [Dibothriocephalus latus]
MRSNGSCGVASNAASTISGCASGSANDRPDSADPSQSSLTTSPSRPKSSRFVQHLRRLTLPLALGQLLSALIAVTGIASNYLVGFGVSLPLTQNLPSYFLLTIVYGIFSWRRLLSPKEPPMTTITSEEPVEAEDQSGIQEDCEESMKNAEAVVVVPTASGDTESL